MIDFGEDNNSTITNSTFYNSFSIDSGGNLFNLDMQLGMIKL